MHTTPAHEHPPEWYARELHARATRHVDYPEGRYAGRGIVTVAGGRRYLAGAWASASAARALGVTLPIQLWYFGDEECDDRMRALFATLGVECVDAKETLWLHPSKSLLRPRGASRFARFELKCYAIVHSAFEEVLFLDADNVPLRDPSGLFDDPEYRAKGALFWPDPPYGARPLDKRAWGACGLPMQPGPSFESGQLLVDKRRCWNQLQLCAWMNEESDYWFSLLYGDKDSYKVAWHVTKAPYAMAPMPRSTFAGILQHAPDGGTMFYHRWFRKPRLSDRRLGLPVADHPVAQRAYAAGLSALRAAWDGRLWAASGPGDVPPAGTYRCFINRETFVACVRRDGTVVSSRPSFRSFHAGDVRGEPCAVAEGDDRVACFLRRDGASWVGTDANGAIFRLSPEPGRPFLAAALSLRGGVSDAYAVARRCMRTVLRAIEVVAVTIVGDDLSGSIRQSARDVAALVLSETPRERVPLMTPFPVSFVIPAHNEEGYVRGCVEACFSCAADDVVREVIVVDNASTDGTASVLRELRDKYGVRMKIVEEPKKGIAHARKAGLAAATGEFFASVDADCIPDADWIRSMRRAFAAYPDAACVSGPYSYYDLPRRYRWLFEAKEVFLGLVGLLFSVGGSQVCGGNFIARRSALVAADAFSADAQVIGEDVEVERRLKTVGPVHFFRSIALPSSCRRLLKEGFFYTFFMTRISRYFQLYTGAPLRTKTYEAWR